MSALAVCLVMRLRPDSPGLMYDLGGRHRDPVRVRSVVRLIDVEV